MTPLLAATSFIFRGREVEWRDAEDEFRIAGAFFFFTASGDEI